MQVLLTLSQATDYNPNMTPQEQHKMRVSEFYIRSPFIAHVCVI